MGNIIKCSIAALIGGAVRAAIWAGITYATNHEIGWIAWGIGLLVGISVRFAAGESDGFVPGTIAVLGAILALLAGKYAAVHLLVNHELSNADTITVTSEDMCVGIADEVVEEWETAGKPVNWAPGMTVDEAGSEADYPADIWAEAEKRWNEIPPDEQESQLEERRAAIAMLTDMMRGQITDAGFKDSFNAMDLLFFALAVYTAFKVGSGMAAGA
ncbi:MAG: hypothetical protein R3C20_09120 [Planctomycetaceae bacterium]